METEKKKGFLGKLAGAFVDTDEEMRPTRQPMRAQPAQMAAQPVGSYTPAAQITTAAVPLPTQGSEKFVALLRQGLEERALSTYDYLKFSKGVAGLKSIVFDEGQRFKAAFTTAASMGVTKQSLLSSTKHYLDALAEERKEFQAKLSQENDSRIGGGQQELSNIDQQLQSKQAEVARLNQEIVTLASRRTELSNKIEQDKLLCSQTQASFQSAYVTIEQEIASDAQKIATFITE